VIEISGNNYFDYILWLFPVAVGIYTLGYARFLWRRQLRLGAIGVSLLALLTVLYSGVALFFIHI